MVSPGGQIQWFQLANTLVWSEYCRAYLALPFPEHLPSRARGVSLTTDDVQVHTFTINVPSTVTLGTFSYGGGTNGFGQFGLCGDSALTVNNMQAGTYTAAHTEFFNVPNGLSLSNGFLEDDEGKFARATALRNHGWIV
jgi:hypothetical protein